jgi:small-conductance mechanosensitive channel
MKKIFLLIVFALTSWWAGAAQEPIGGLPLGTPPTEVAKTEFPLVLFNREVFLFRAPLAGVSAPDRARRAYSRIHEQLEQPGPNKVTQVTESLGILIQIDGGTSFVITPADIDASQGETLAKVAANAIAVMQVAIGESQESRNLESMLQAFAKAGAATVVLSLVIWAVVRVRRKLTTVLLNLTHAHTENLQVGGVKVFQGDRAVALMKVILSVIYRVIIFVLLYNWLSYCLSRFPFTRVWGETLNTLLIDFLATVGKGVLGALPGLAIAVLIFFAARWCSNVLDHLFERIRLGQIETSAWLDTDVVAPTRRIAKVLVWLFALAMAYPYLPGAHTQAFQGLSVLAGLMISLGASNLVGQAASGLILTYGRVFRKGEYVRVADHEGTVTEMGMFATRIRTGLGEELTIANSKILDSTTKNYSRVIKGAGFVLDTTVGVSYETPWRQVHAMLLIAAERTEGVLADPKPVVFQTELTGFSPIYRLVCQAIPSEPRPRALVLSQLHANVQDVFSEYGVQLLTPAYCDDPDAPKLVAANNWYPAPARKPQSVN